MVAEDDATNAPTEADEAAQAKARRTSTLMLAVGSLMAGAGLVSLFTGDGGQGVVLVVIGAGAASAGVVLLRRSKV
jgi:hypothetical protein